MLCYLKDVKAKDQMFSGNSSCFSKTEGFINPNPKHRMAVCSYMVFTTDIIHFVGTKRVEVPFLSYANKELGMD